jgi:ribonuclease P protein component
LVLSISKKIFQSKEVSIFFDKESPSKTLKIIIKKDQFPLAIKRNKAKRWVKEVFKKNKLGPGFLVVLRSGFLEKGFGYIDEGVSSVLQRFKKTDY